MCRNWSVFYSKLPNPKVSPIRLFATLYKSTFVWNHRHLTDSIIILEMSSIMYKLMMKWLMRVWDCGMSNSFFIKHIWCLSPRSAQLHMQWLLSWNGPAYRRLQPLPGCCQVSAGAWSQSHRQGEHDGSKTLSTFHFVEFISLIGFAVKPLGSFE